MLGFARRSRRASVAVRRAYRRRYSGGSGTIRRSDPPQGGAFYRQIEEIVGRAPALKPLARQV
jgi:hypothetical protein